MAVAFVVLLLLLSPALIWRIGLASDVRERFATLRAAGRPVDLTSLEKMLPAVPPEENGATLYREAAVLYQNLPMESWEALPFRKANSLMAGQPLPQRTRLALEALVAQNGPALDLLHRAAARTRNRYVEQFDARMGLSALSHLGATKSMVDLLCAEALLACDAGEAQRALLDLNAALALINSLDNDGLLESLTCQWEQDSKVMMVLERVMGQSMLDAQQLAPFRAHFRPARRKTQWERMCDVESCLFLVRIARGDQRGPLRDLLIMAGVGDLNVRAYLDLMDEVRDGFGVSVAEQKPLQVRYRTREAEVAGHPFVYATLQLYRPNVWWTMIRDSWDEVRVVETALALANFRSIKGHYPEAIEELVPEYLESYPGSLADGAALGYVAEDSGFRLSREAGNGESQPLWTVLPVIQAVES